MEQIPAESPSPSTPDPVSATGHDHENETVPSTEAGPDPEAAARREQKLIVTLRPLPAPGGAAYRAVLAVGAEGCDPLIEATEVDGLPAALRAAERLMAQAEQQWRTRPRHPTWSPPPGRPDRRQAATRRAPRTPAAPGPTPAAPPAAAPEPPTASDAAAPPAPAPGLDRGGATGPTGPATQLPLFGER